MRFHQTSKTSQNSSIWWYSRWTKICWHSARKVPHHWCRRHFPARWRTLSHTTKTTMRFFEELDEKWVAVIPEKAEPVARFEHNWNMIKKKMESKLSKIVEDIWKIAATKINKLFQSMRRRVDVVIKIKGNSSSSNYWNNIITCLILCFYDSYFTIFMF